MVPGFLWDQLPPAGINLGPGDRRFWWFLVLSIINHSILGVSNFDTSHTHVIYIYACFLLHEYIEIIGACKWDFNTILFYNDSIIAYYI